MTPIQQLFLGVGAKKKTYLDDVFSTYLWTGNGSNSAARTMANGLDLAGEGGMVWIKQRTGTNEAKIVDTVRGLTGTSPYYVMPSESNAQGDRGWNWSFLNNGFSFNQDYGDINGNNEDYASFSFRKTPGFFDVVTYTGNGTAGRTVSHNLGSVPGFIAIKCTSDADHWCCYHKSRGGTKFLALNSSDAESTNGNGFHDTTPTSTQVTLGASGRCNGNSKTYVMYLFAGGESTAATAVSVTGFDNSRDMQTDNAHADFAFGTGDFTVESWFRFNEDDVTMGLWTISSAANAGGNTAVDLQYDEDRWRIAKSGGNYSDFISPISKGVWYHTALVRESGVLKLYINGVLGTTFADTTDYSSDARVGIGYDRAKQGFAMHNGDISNFRVVKGTAVYTSSFRPPTTPLTNITNTKLLCCQNSTPLVTTVIPSGVTMTRNTDAITESSDSPFDDPAAFTFGDAGDQNVIKCGSHTHSSTDNVRIYTGWEPQWVMTKNASVSSNWAMFDCTRGIVVGGDGPSLAADSSAAENGVLGSNQFVIPHGDGFSLKYGGTAVNPGNGNTIIYIVIRRSDGYVGKPIEDATKCFAMDTGSSSSPGPEYDSGFPVDFAIHRTIASTNDWWTSARLIQGKHLETNNTGAESTSDAADYVFDYNDGWYKNGYGSGVQSWMWKRHAGFDVVAYGPGNEVEGRRIPHSLNKIPEMIWIKNRDSTDHWSVYHKGLNGGTNPEQYYLWLETDDDESSTSVYWNNTAPTSTHFTVGNGNAVNQNNKNYIAMLFASVNGISKVGYYSGSSGSQTITVGFQPRFLIIKKTSGDANWWVLDTTRGWASGNESYLALNENNAQWTDHDFGQPTSTGFTLTTDSIGSYNDSGEKYIYYAHA